MLKLMALRRQGAKKVQVEFWELHDLRIREEIIIDTCKKLEIITSLNKNYRLWNL